MPRHRDRHRALMLGYIAFLRGHARHVLFGVLLMALSSFGQTFFIALFGAELRADFALSDGALGTAYAIGTFASAMVLRRAGRLIDRVPIRHYTIAVALLLATACAVMASGTGIAILVLAVFLLRLGGQGLMVHTALTVTARAFPADRGKALGIANTGMAVGEALLPLLVVAGIALFGWRGVWWLAAVVVLAGALLALAHTPPQPTLPAETATGTSRAHAGPPLWRDPRLLLTLPAVLASSFIITGFFFHQARLLEEKDWDFAWWASCFAAYAVTRTIALLAIGPVIDRVGAVRLLPVSGIPLALSMACLALIGSHWGAPTFLILVAISAGMGATLLTALWMELYGPDRLAEIRATAAAGSVIASGLAPTLMGWLIDLGIPLAIQAAGCAAYAVLAITLATRVKAYARPA